MAEENVKSEEGTGTPEDKKEKTYTKTEMLTYCGLTGLLAGVIGYFIGEHRGEKKAKEKYEHAVNTWKSKSGKKGNKSNEEEEFVL
jgi:hypothetical protein